MSLNWNMQAVKDLDAIKDDNAINEVIIFATMFIGMHSITDKNAREFYQRLNLMEKVDGTYTYINGNEPYYITQEDINKRIGLTTNASDFSRAELWRRIQKRHFTTE